MLRRVFHVKIETIRALYVYTAALFTLGGGFVFLYTYREPDAQDVRLIVAGLMGVAASFLFTSEAGTSAARQSERAASQAVSQTGAMTGGPGIYGPAPASSPARPWPDPDPLEAGRSDPSTSADPPA